MRVKVSVGSGLSVGDLVQWDSVNSQWVALSDSSVSLFGVVTSEPAADQTEGSTLTLAHVQFAGECRAKASREIPEGGGVLDVEVGGVFVNDASTHNCGFVAPQNYLGEARPVGALVQVFLR